MSLLNFGFTLDHACGGNCACTTCHVWVKKGRESLAHGRRRGRPAGHGRRSAVKLASRLPVQIIKPGEVVVEIPAWNRNYVSEEH